MLKNLFDLIKDQASESVINNPAIPNEQNDAVVAEATNTVAGGLQNIMAGGGLQNILAMFGGNDSKEGLAKNGVVSMMIGHFMSKLTSKFGMQGNQAGNVAGDLIPSVLGKLINKTKDPNDNSFNMNSIIEALSGKGQGTGGSGVGGINFQDLLSKFSGGSMDTNQDGKVGLDDIISKVTGGTQQQVQQQNTGGGLMDIIKGFIK